MEPVAVIFGAYELRWSTIIILLAVFAWFFQAYSLYAAHGRRRLALCCFAPVAVALSYFFCKSIYWYCHIEQYHSLREVLSFSTDGYAMLGVIPGIVLAALLVRLLRLTDDLPALLDALAPASALGIGLLYLTALYNDSCRGKLLFHDPAYLHLPFSSPVQTAQGDTEYRLATFFLSFLVFVLLFGLLREYYIARHEERGATASLFLLLFSAAEFILDSTRYDAGYFQFNGFVSVLQIFAGLSILGLSIWYSIRSIKKSGFHWFHIPLWLLILASMGATGWLEYLIQRHGNWYRMCYSLMALSCLGMVVFPYLLSRTGRSARQDASAPSDAPAKDDASAPSDAPAKDDASAPSDAPAKDDASAPSDAPAKDDTSAPSDAPAKDDASSAQPDAPSAEASKAST